MPLQALIRVEVFDRDLLLVVDFYAPMSAILSECL
jgi:hypothetical protein